MARNIIPLQRERAARVFGAEWLHQITALEHSLTFMEDQFQWAMNQLEQVASGTTPEAPCATNVSDMAFFCAESPAVLQEAREALRVLKLLSRADD